MNTEPHTTTLVFATAWSTFINLQLTPTNTVVPTVFSVFIEYVLAASNPIFLVSASIALLKRVSRQGSRMLSFFASRPPGPYGDCHLNRTQHHGYSSPFWAPGFIPLENSIVPHLLSLRSCFLGCLWVYEIIPRRPLKLMSTELCLGGGKVD